MDGAPAAALEAAHRADDAGVDPRRLGGELVRLLRDLVVLRVAPGSPGLVDAADADLAAMRELAGRAEPTRLRRMFRALVRELEDLAWAPEPFAVLELALVRLATLPEASVQCCVTSPPYWGLRDYGTARWEGGDVACDHKQRNARNDPDRDTRHTDGRNPETNATVATPSAIQFRQICGKCGARRDPQPPGPTPLPSSRSPAM